MKKTYCRKILPAMLLACLLLLTACSEEAEEPQTPQPDFITLIDGETLVADREGGDVMLRFQTNKEWTIELPVTQEHFNGVLEQRSGPAGEVSVAFAALPNTKGAARSTTLRIKAGRASADVKVTQNAVEVDLPSEEELKARLMRLYHDTDGPNWRFQGRWGSDLPLSQWGSEVKYEKGLLSLNLLEHDLKGDIDLSGCTALVSIKCTKNQIRRLNLAGCTMLTDVECVNTGLEEIDLTGCMSLRHLNVSYNSLSRIDVGWCMTLEEAYLQNCRLEALDLSDCVMLQTLNCSANRLSALEIPHRYRLMDCFCYENEIRRLDLSGAPMLQILNCGDNELQELNVQGSPRLEWIYCYNNRLRELDIADKKDVLTHLYCFSNRLETLDVAGCRKLSELHCSDNNLGALDLTGCKSLRWLYCSYNRLETLDFSGIDTSALERLDCSYNRLREADIASLPMLLRLWCQGNRIGGEIPAHFSRLLEFEYDIRYEYRPQTGTYTDRGYGWWYPGEPEKMAHTP